MKDKTINGRIATCDPIAQKVFEALSAQNIKAVNKYLAFTFTFLGQRFPLGKMVFNATIEQLGGNYTNIKRTKEELNDDVLTLEYEFLFSLDTEVKTRTATFYFNKNNKIVSIDLSMFQINIDSILEGDEEEEDEDEAKPLRISMSDEDVITIPIELVQDVPFVTATINGEQRRFMFDSGAEGLVLNSKYFKLVSTCVDEGQGKRITAKGYLQPDGNIEVIRNTHITDFDFYGIYFENAIAPMFDLSHLEKIAKIEIAGLIGYEIFMAYDVLYDYPNGCIKLIWPDAEDAQSEMKPFEMIPFEMIGVCPHITLKVQDIELKLGLDSGCSSLSVDARFYDPLLPYLTIEEGEKVAGVKYKKKVQAGIVDEVIVDNVAVHKASVMFDGYECEEGSDGVFGFPVLSQCKVLVRYGVGELGVRG